MNITDIVELAKQLEQDFHEQSLEDKRAKEAVLQMGLVDAQGKEVAPVGAGHDPMVYKQKFVYLSATPYLRFNPPKSELAEHAEKLENIFEGIWLLSQGALDVWRGMVKRAVWSGRGIGKITCWPAAWGDDPFQQGDEEDDEYNARLDRLKAENFPIAWRLVESENTWPTYDARGNLDELVGLREMTARAVRKAYGDILQGEHGDREKIKVIEYDDDEECVTLVMDSAMGKTEPREAKRWAHGMGVNPNVIIELEPTPPTNDKGIRWTGCSFDGRHARPHIDSILSDALYNFKRDTRAGTDYYLDKESTEGSTPEAAATARGVKDQPGEPNFFWKGEERKRLQSAQTNPDGFTILNHLLMMSRDMDISDTLKGQLLNDVTGIGYNTAGQLAEKQFEPTIENFKRGAKAVGLRFSRSIKAFAREFEGIKDAPTDIPVIYVASHPLGNSPGASYSLSVKPKDTEGWENRIQPRLSLAIPVNENAQLTVYRLATEGDNPAMDEDQARSRFLGDERTVETRRNVTRDLVRRGLVPKFVDLIAQNGLQLISKPEGDMGAIAELIATFTPEEQQALMKLAATQGQPFPNLARGEANRNRTGMAQNPTGARQQNAQSY